MHIYISVIISRTSKYEIRRTSRIITRKIINHLKELNESHGFLRGMVAFVGFKQSFIEYDRDHRRAGKSKYNKFVFDEKNLNQNLIKHL